MSKNSKIPSGSLAWLIVNVMVSRVGLTRYLREYQPLGTAGGLFHFRDVILSGSPELFIGLYIHLSRHINSLVLDFLDGLHRQYV